MKLAEADRRKLLAQLERLVAAIEDLLLTGLTTASEATRQALGVTFQEAARLKLLRLGSTLRVANEELGRYTRNDAAFSQRRLVFFLNRSWLLARGLLRAYRENDEAALQRLLWTAPTRPVARVDVVTLGVVKKVALGAFCAFEFRLRAVSNDEGIAAGTPLTWSAVFPIKPDNEIPPEGFLHLPHEQKFTAHAFLEKRVITLEKVQFAREDPAAGRITLTKESTVRAGEPFAEWPRFLTWDVTSVAERFGRHEANPFELEVELHEEAVLDDWQLGSAGDATADGRIVTPLAWRGLTFDATLSASVEGDATRKALAELGKKKRSRPPLYGLLHGESCRFVFQPLTTFESDGPKYLTISDEAIDRKSLLKALKFT